MHALLTYWVDQNPYHEIINLMPFGADTLVRSDVHFLELAAFTAMVNLQNKLRQ